jgi:hypothetical protein
MTRPAVACICVDLGIHNAIYADGPTRLALIDAFRRDHAGLGHIEEQPPRDWYGKEAEFRRHLERVRADLRTAPTGPDGGRQVVQDARNRLRAFS